MLNDHYLPHNGLLANNTRSSIYDATSVRLGGTVDDFLDSSMSPNDEGGYVRKRFAADIMERLSTRRVETIRAGCQS